MQFLDANNATFKIYVDPPPGRNDLDDPDNPVNNAFQGSAKRVG